MSTNNGQLEGPAIDEALSVRINEIKEKLADRNASAGDQLKLLNELTNIEPLYDQLVATREELQNIIDIPRDQAQQLLIRLDQLENNALYVVDPPDTSGYVLGSA